MLGELIQLLLLLQGCIEIIYILVQSILYTVIVYFMCGFIRDAGKFFWFLLVSSPVAVVQPG